MFMIICSTILVCGGLLGASQTIIMSIAACTMATNAVITPLCSEREKGALERGRWVVSKGTWITIVGAGLICAASMKSNTALNTVHIEKLFDNVNFVAFEVAATLIVFLLFIAVRCDRHNRRAGKDSVRMRLFFGYIAGWAGTQQALMAKSLLEIGKSHYLGGSLTPIGRTFFTMAGVCFFMVFLSFFVLDRAMKDFKDTVKYIAISQACLIVLGSTGGLIFFQEHADFEPWNWGLFLGGMVMCVWGVAVLGLAEGIQESVEKRERVARRHAHGRPMKQDPCYVDIICGISDDLCGCYHDPEEGMNPLDDEGAPIGEEGVRFIMPK